MRLEQWGAGKEHYRRASGYPENIIIRLERENEYHEVENLVRESF